MECEKCVQGERYCEECFGREQRYWACYFGLTRDMTRSARRAQLQRMRPPMVGDAEDRRLDELCEDCGYAVTRCKCEYYELERQRMKEERNGR